MKLPCLFAALALAACASNSPDDNACADPHYADGTCDTELACGVPDIDCFRSYQTDAEATDWVTSHVPALVLQETDPAFVRARALLDRAWALYTADVPLGDLSDARPALVVVASNAADAATAADTVNGYVPLIVIVTPKLVSAEHGDDEVIGKLLRELAHATHLHNLGDVAERTRKFYVAGAPEQLGADAEEDPAARDAATRWRADADLVGPPMTPAFPLPAQSGWLGTLFYSFGDECTEQADYASHYLDQLFDPLTQTYDLPQTFDFEANAIFECAAHESTTLRELIAPFLDTPLAPKLAPIAERFADELDRPYHVAIASIVAALRGEMLDIQTSFAHATGAPWTKLRMYTAEEAADDVAAQITARHHLSVHGAGAFAMSQLGDYRTACETALASNTVPYGADLTNDSHAPCWREQHARRVAAAAQ